MLQVRQAYFPALALWQRVIRPCMSSQVTPCVALTMLYSLSNYHIIKLANCLLASYSYHRIHFSSNGGGNNAGHYANYNTNGNREDQNIRCYKYREPKDGF
jgi:hypothetical protein